MLVGVLVDVLVVVGVLVDVVVDVVVVVELVVVVGDELVDVVVADCEHWLWASEATVEAPCWRLVVSAGLMLDGRLLTVLFSASAAFAAAPHWPASSAEVSWSSWPWRLLAWSLDSRPWPPPPHATRNDAAKPSPPASSARGA